jgi:hypothetical protein
MDPMKDVEKHGIRNINKNIFRLYNKRMFQTGHKIMERMIWVLHRVADKSSYNKTKEMH